ncbi:uncharacterized protein SCHCODRAFT_02107841 [Schizophyllum commune H4-8]|uniref:uncharacterized protein n=1 Tax=Schizophyllum commune (strain H4-8 / FGSC 9210) TaxID=578458 RepID=UPI00215F13DA|nr:uncharacterized protein SCHCODRAFT_02107841 [Schizophyllum commune H4-8]KAI5885908.1 hypothetical protein SCHCODRAFT_02107841 [Schizophyllum commune H4-8]
MFRARACSSPSPSPRKKGCCVAVSLEKESASTQKLRLWRIFARSSCLSGPKIWDDITTPFLPFLGTPQSAACAPRSPFSSQHGPALRPSGARFRQRADGCQGVLRIRVTWAQEQSVQSCLPVGVERGQVPPSYHWGSPAASQAMHPDSYSQKTP